MCDESAATRPKLNLNSNAPPDTGRPHLRFVQLFQTALLAAIFALAPAATAQLKPEAQALRNFGAVLDDASTAPDFVGLAVAVVRDGRIVLTKTYGVREAGSAEPITPDTVFRLASLSKGFAATLAVLEARDGRFALSDPVSESVPQFRLRTAKDTAAVTVEDILSHRTGLPPFAFDNLLEAGVAPMEILGRYKTVKLICPVRECYAYQNSTFNMIVNVIESATGKPFGEELRVRLFEPLGLKTASLGVNGLRGTGNWARPHMRRDDVWSPVEVKEAYYKLPAAGGMNASITDLARWVAAHMGANPEILPPEILANLSAPRIATPAETRRQRILKTPVTNTHYGLGWRTYDYAGSRVVTHSGGVEGYFAQIAYLPDSKSGIVILSNTRGARAGKILPTWLDHELGLPKTNWLRLDEIDGDSADPAAPAGN